MSKRVREKTSRRAGAAKAPLSRSLRIYQKIAVVFVIVAMLLLLAVLYLSVSQATIHIKPKLTVVSTTVAAEIAESPSAIGQIEGVMFQEKVTKTKTFSIPQDESGKAVEAKAGGMVTLINENSVDQPLVATTRLLSKEGVLFRIDEAVIIPAKGQLNTMAHADQVGKTGEIGPTQFTIPGLPTSMQDKVYAVSVDSMTGGVKYIRVVTQEDLDQAQKDLTDQMVEETKTAFRTKAGESKYSGEVFDYQILEKVSTTAPGTETGSFDITLTLQITGIFYQTQALEVYAQTKLYEQAPEGYKVVSSSKENLQASVQSIDAKRSTATINIYVDGYAVIAQNNELLNKDRFAGRSASEVEALLTTSDAIEDISVTFTPFWLKRVPTLEDHIKIMIEDAQ